MKNPFEPIKSICLGLLLAAASLAHAQITLIGGDIRNGNFNTTTTTTDGGTFAQTPFWDNLGTGGNTSQATRSNFPYDTTRNAQLSNALTNTIIHAQDTGHTILAGDVFSLSYVWRDAANWDRTSDKVRVTLFTTADNTLTGTATNLAVTTSALNVTTVVYQTETFSDFYTAVGGDSGKSLFVKIDTENNGDGSGLARLDNFLLTVVAVPAARYELTSPPSLMKIADGGIKTTSFTISNTGAGQDLSISNPVFGDPRFTLLSPTLPVNIAPGGSLEFVVQADMSASTINEDILTSLALTTNDATSTARSVDLRAQVLVGGKRVLVDYDDGIANGIHEASILNGGFEDSVAGSSFAATADWFSRFPEGDLVQLTYNTTPFAIGKYGVASGWVSPGNRAQPVVGPTLDEWTLEEGDSFTIEFTWRNGTGFVEGDVLQLLVEIVDEAGNAIADATNSAPGATNLLSSTELSLAALGTPQTDTITTVTVPAGSPWIGGRPRFRFLKNGSRDTFVELDNVSVVGSLYSPPTGAISITNFSYNATTKNVTLRWIDGGYGTYTIQSDADLDFTSGTTVYTLDGSEDTSTYPGEIEYIFNDPTATGAKNFWRVVGE